MPFFIQNTPVSIITKSWKHLCLLFPTTYHIKVIRCAVRPLTSCASCVLSSQARHLFLMGEHTRMHLIASFSLTSSPPFLHFNGIDMGLFAFFFYYRNPCLAHNSSANHQGKVVQYMHSVFVVTCCISTCKS